jgi:predicted PurR-regulated permease PerM
LLLGRGLDVPMLVILLGAIGGMIYAGIVGLFVGAVVLVLGYELIEFWVTGDEVVEKTAEPDTASDAV